MYPWNNFHPLVLSIDLWVLDATLFTMCDALAKRKPILGNAEFVVKKPGNFLIRKFFINAIHYYIPN